MNMPRYVCHFWMLISACAFADLTGSRSLSQSVSRLRTTHPELNRLCDLPLSVIGTGEADQFEVSVHSTFRLSPEQMADAARQPELFDGVQPTKEGLIYSVSTLRPKQNAGAFETRFEPYKPDGDTAKEIESKVRFTTGIYAERNIIPLSEVEWRTDRELNLYSPLRREYISYTDRKTGANRGVARLYHGSPTIAEGDKSFSLPTENDSYLLPLERSHPGFELPGRVIREANGSRRVNKELFAIEWGLLGGAKDIDGVAVNELGQTARLLKKRYYKNGTYPNDPVMYAEVTDGGLQKMIKLGWKLLAGPKELDGVKDSAAISKYVLEYKVSDFVADHYSNRVNFPVTRVRN